MLQDEAVARLWLTIDEKYQFRPGKDFFWTVVEDEARRHGYHPVRDYLDGLKWDGEARIDDWLIKYGGADDTPFIRAVGALFLIAAVRRIRQPGCKFDEMLVLRSPQGTMKSSALRALVPEEDWFSDDLPLNGDTKTVIERLHGRWIVEAAELKGMRNSGIEHLKAFLSRQVDRSRMAYGRITKEAPRQCVIAGTTNSERFLKDNTGNRRFWPIVIDRFDVEAIRRDRDQIWAEASEREASGESIRLDSGLYPAAAEVQEEHRVEDPYLMELKKVLGDIEGKILAADVWEIIDLPVGQRSQHHNERIGEAMRELDFRRKKLRFGGKNPDNCYVRGDEKRRILVRRNSSGNAYVVLEGDEPPF
jgi:predicted P-loop ATPase